MAHGTRDELLGCLARAVRSVTAAHPTRVAVDGPPAAGKTTLADELAVVLRAEGRHVVRATIDDFLFPRARRYRRGEFSAESCYLDAHDHDTLNRVLLDPLGPGGDRRFRTAAYDRAADAAMSPPATTAPADTVLIFDGVFLLRRDLIDRWDLRILVSTALDTTVDRAVRRERGVSSQVEVERRWRERYIPAQRLYVADVRPAERAHIVVHNDDPGRPTWDRPGAGEPGPVRVGDTIRRPAHRRSQDIDELLQHLADAGFAGAPRPLGYDDRGRQVLTFIDGEVPGAGPYRLSDARIRSAALLIRAFHDAAAPSVSGTGHETVCHGDLGPHNTVFRGEDAVGIIDFDADVGPGRRVDDLAHAVWCFADLTETEVDVAEQARKAALMCDTYGGVAVTEVVHALTARFDRARAQHLAAGRPGAAQVFDDLLRWMSLHGDRLAAG